MGDKEIDDGQSTYMVRSLFSLLPHFLVVVFCLLCSVLAFLFKKKKKHDPFLDYPW